MLRSVLTLLAFAHLRAAFLTDPPTFADRLDKLYEKLESLTVAPGHLSEKSPQEKLYAKLAKFNALSPKLDLSDEDEELLSVMQLWGRLSPDQIDEFVKDLHRMKEDTDEKKDRLTEEYDDIEWNDEFQEIHDTSEIEYPQDVGKDDWDTDDDPEGSTSKPVLLITPLAITRNGGYKTTIVSAEDPIASTNARPRILDDASISMMEQSALRRAAMANMARVVSSGKCLVPQARWLLVRQLAPAADTRYMPPCVQLHRCAPDSGCCYNNAEVCAPIEGKFVAIPFFLQNANGSMKASRMLFYNHTQCACVSKETLQTTIRTRVEKPNSGEKPSSSEKPSSGEKLYSGERYERQNDWRAPTEEPTTEEGTAQPQLKRCTCPVQFHANMTESTPCSCVCNWPDATRRRDCLSLARGKEHFGLRDRVCISSGACNLPSCDYGKYDQTTGRCPFKRYKRLRYHTRSKHHIEKTHVV